MKEMRPDSDFHLEKILCQDLAIYPKKLEI